ncbi:MAG: response regulator, partial [Acaryochloridaceae cyanobacterium RU_4_10]|nr:response regulator [Acaryochloridaceae cyanobacterium RU_4_10]
MKCVLVIDDDNGIRNLIRFSLEALTLWEVLTASSGKEGLAIAQSRHLDAILLDVMMPDLDGVATFRQLQVNPSTKGIPTIFLTAKAQAKEYEEHLALGIAGVITKPFKAQILVA